MAFSAAWFCFTLDIIAVEEKKVTACSADCRVR
jgi:hypothetical protein